MDLSALDKISYGLYIVSSRKDERFNGQIINIAIQVTSQPCKVAVIINKKNLTHDYLTASKVFTISILAQTTPVKFIGHFGFKSGRDTDKFKDVRFRIGRTGASIILENTVGYLECELDQILDVGTHTVFVGTVVDAELTSSEEPLTYAYYHEEKDGKTSENAPTYRKEEERKEEMSVTRYRCTVCGYVYDPAAGDPESGVKPNTPFEALSESWVCPICGAPKDKFMKEE